MVQGINKQQTGFKFGKHTTTLKRQCGEVVADDGRKYRLVLLETGDKLEYYALRLYNGRGKFIKQFLFSPDLLDDIAGLLDQEIYDPQGE